LIVVAAIGASLLLIVALNRWATPSDEHAYWLAGQRLLSGEPLYDPTASPNTPYAFWYPPIVAQVMAPISAILPSMAFTIAWTVLLLGCIWYLGLRLPLVALGLVAFIPVAVELWFRNVHLVLAVLIVLGLRRWPVALAIAAAIKISPVLGVLYLLVRGRRREAFIVGAVGFVMLAVSVAIGPEQWSAFFAMVAARGPADTSGFLPIPYVVRAVAGIVLTIVAARVSPRIGEPLLVVAIVIALPTLWVTALSTLAALVPIVAWWWLRDRRAHSSAELVRPT
jgi:hypothetical protein